MGFWNRREYRVIHRGRSGLVYREAGRSVLVSSELLADGEFDLAVEIGSIQSWTDGVGLNEQEKLRIERNIRHALRKLNILWE